MKHHAKTRCVGWRWVTDDPNNDAPPTVERLLADARTRGLVSEYDVGRGGMWFNAAPGREARELRNAVDRLLVCWRRVGD